MSYFCLAGVGEKYFRKKKKKKSLNPSVSFSNNSMLYAVCLCVCARLCLCVCSCARRAHNPPSDPHPPSDCVGMRQPSQLEGYLGTCVLRESPRANALGTSHGGHTHKHNPRLSHFGAGRCFDLTELTPSPPPPPSVTTMTTTRIARPCNPKSKLKA